MKPFLTGLCTCLLMILTGCTKDSSQFIASPLSDTAWVQQILPANAIAHLSDTLHINPVSDSVNLLMGDTATLSGIQYVFPAGGWETETGVAFQGTALLQDLLLQKPGDWIRNFVSTSYQGKPIQTSAVVYFNVSSGSETLKPTSQVLVTFPVSNPSQTDSLFSGSYTDNTLQWSGTIPGVYGSRGKTNVDGFVQYAQTFGTQQTGWLMSGMESSDSLNNGSKLVVVLPNQFSNANSAVFCLLKDLPAVVMLTGDYSTRTFIGSNLPVGATANIITLTFTGNSFYLGTQTLTLENGAVAVSVNPSLATLPSLIQYLQQL